MEQHGLAVLVIPDSNPLQRPGHPDTDDMRFITLEEVERHEDRRGTCRAIPHRCAVCDEVFRRASHHRLHLREAHGWVYPWYLPPPHNPTVLKDKGRLELKLIQYERHRETYRLDHRYIKTEKPLPTAPLPAQKTEIPEPPTCYHEVRIIRPAVKMEAPTPPRYIYRLRT